MAGPGRLRRWVLRPAVWSLAALALLLGLGRLFLGSELARERARDLLVARLADALDRAVTIDRVDFSLLPLGLTVDGLRIASDRAGEPPLATVRRLVLEGDLEGFRRSELVLRTVAIDGLDLRLEFRPDGTDNLPRPRRSGATTRQLALRVDGLSIADSAVTVAERRAKVDVRARAVAARLAGLGRTDLVGSVAAQEIELGLPKATPVGLALAARVRLLSDRLEIEAARVSGPDFAAQVSGRIGWKSATRIELAGQVESSGAFVDRLGYLHGEIAGPIAFDGGFEWRREAWGFRGEVTSPGLDLFGFRLDDLAGSVAGEERTIRFDLARGRFEGGQASGSFAVDLEPGSYPARLDLALDGAELERVLARFSVPIAGLAGEVSGPFRYDFDLTDAERGEGGGDFRILPATAPGARVPATGGALLRLTGGRVELPAIELATPGQRVTASGAYDLVARRGSFDLETQSEDLGELVRLLPIAEPGSLWQPTSGTGLVSGRIEIAPRGFAADLELACAAVEAPGFSAGRLTGSVSVTERAVEALDLLLENPGARLALAGRLPFEEPAPGAAAGELDLRLRAEGWPVESAAPWLPFELPLAGRAQGTLALGGSLARLTGRLDATVTEASTAGLELGRLTVALGWDGDRLELERATVAALAGAVEASGELRFADGGLDLVASSPALDLAAPPFSNWTAGRLGGSLRPTLRASGTLERPALALEAEILAPSVAGAALGEGERGRLDARWSEGRLTLAAELPGLARIAGAGPCSLEAGAELELTVGSDRLDRLAALATGAPVDGLEGRLAANLSLSLPKTGAARLTLVAPTLDFRYRGRELASLEPVRAELDAAGLHLRSLYLGLAGEPDELFVGGDIRLAAEPELDLRVQASLAASWLRPLLADLDLGGRVDMVAVVRGTAAHPQLNGQAEWSGGRWIPPQIPHTIERASALVLFYPNALVIDHAGADFAGGRLVAKGRIELPAAGEPSYRVEATAREVTLRWPAGWVLRGDGDFTLASMAEGRQLRGEVRLERAFYLQDIKLSPAQLLQRILTRSRLEVAETDDLLATTYLALALRAQGALRVRNNLANLSGGGDLSVRGTLARPVAFGELAVEPGGTVEYGGNRYEIARGLVTFANPERIEPLLDFVARTRIDQYDVTVRLGGTLDRLETNFASDPPLPDLDVLSLLSSGAPLGETTTTASASGVGPAAPGSSSQAAERLLYGQASALISSRVGTLFGFDKLRIDPLTTGDTLSAARVTVGKRISRQLYVTYSVDPSSTAQQILQVEWRVTDRIVLVLTQNGNESYSVDARWESGF